jgi:hypothetical protein
MKKKGLKPKLKPRHKTLPQPDIMHDFGELGKWSESTLRANAYISPIFVPTRGFSDGRFDCYVKTVKEIYDKKWKDYRGHVDILMKKRYMFPSLDKISNDLNKLKSTNKRFHKLCSDYSNHCKIVESLSIDKIKEYKDYLTKINN